LGDGTQPRDHGLTQLRRLEHHDVGGMPANLLGDRVEIGIAHLEHFEAAGPGGVG
jgi:hypothetical protein